MRIGLIAGNGRMPLIFADEVKRRGDQLVVVALKEEADSAIEPKADSLSWISLGQLSKTIDFFKQNGVERCVMAGQVKHTQLFRGITPDFRTIKLLATLVNKKAESVLGAVIQEFAQEGIQFLPSTLYLEKLLCPIGPLTRIKLNKDQEEDVAFGVPLAKTLSGLDIGQTLVVKDKTVVAVEGMEGTDACIRRAGEVAGKGCVVIKVARPKQDLRFDVPVIGLRTLESLEAANVSVLAVEANKTLLLDKELFLEKANALRIAITGISL